MAHTDFTGTFLFQPPSRLATTSDMSHVALQVAALSGRLALEDRTLVKHRGGRAENVAEHSCMLALVAPVLAEQYYPELDANLIARFATVHDAVEAYVGDTATHDIDQQGLQDKKAREQQGLKQLLQDYSHLQGFTKIITDYENQTAPEARFVRVADKLMPVLIHFIEGGETLRSYPDIPTLVEDANRKADALREEYPEFEKLIDARKELTRLFHKHLL